jgi:hypothetical protein
METSAGEERGNVSAPERTFMNDNLSQSSPATSAEAEVPPQVEEAPSPAIAAAFAFTDIRPILGGMSDVQPANAPGALLSSLRDI